MDAHARRRRSRVCRKGRRQAEPPRVAPLACAVGAVLGAAALEAGAQGVTPAQADEMIVTATRRSLDLHDVPLNIAALPGTELDKREITDLAEIGRNVPGLYVVDQSRRTANLIVVRGLNLAQLRGTEALGNNGGGTVATYVGEIPLYIDLSTADVERVEVLLGPQGTLYGAGTLGGAIRYIPRRPALDTATLTVRGTSFDLAESGGVGMRAGVTANVPLAESLALRATLDYLDDPGYMDAPFLVREPGVSDPEPDFNDPADVAANLYAKKDVNDEETLYARIALRWQPADTVDANLTWYYQDSDIGGRADNHARSFGTGRYVSAQRFLEPNERTNRLAALEVTADLGFAELTSATGYSRYSEKGRRDQTDLLITLELFYELFPAFSAFTLDTIDDRTWSQELRLVSTGLSPWSWIAGAFFAKQTSSSPSREYTPHYDEYLVATDPNAGPLLRPDALEYLSVLDEELKERAVFGEIAYDVNDRLTVSLGSRFYDYDYRTWSGVALPLVDTVYGGLPAGQIDIALAENGQKDHGSLYKVNAAYRFSDDLMGYATISEGYRIGASNGIAPCPVPLPDDQQNVCALPHEVQFFPDKTTSYEIGVRSRSRDGRLAVGASLYHVDWQDPQLISQTAVGAQPITVNGAGAESDGLELSLNAALTPRLDLAFNYAYTRARLTAVAPGLLRVFEPPGFGPTPAVYVDGQPGDRLPGSPKRQGTLTANYAFEAGGGRGVDFGYTIAAVGNVLTKTGGRVGSGPLAGYTVHSASLTFERGPLRLGVYAQNLTNEYALTGVRTQPQFVQTVADENGEPVTVRAYSHSVLRPREIGLKIGYDFDL